MSLPGETVIVINGQPRALRLTLGALAEIEQTIGGGDFETLRERLKTPSAGDLLLILHALMVGGGERLTVDLLKASDIDFRAAAAAIGKAFRGLEPDNSSPACGGGGPQGRRGPPRAPALAEAAPFVGFAATSPASGGRTADAVHSPAPPKKPRARRSPGRRGSAPESSR